MSRCKYLLLLLSCLTALPLAAQQPDVPDSVVVLGSVVNRMSGNPEPFSIVHLLRGDTLVAAAPCDDEGLFEIRAVPAGSYLLEVQVRGLTLYQSDLVLQENAMLNIGVITDSLQLINLREVQITALRHLLGSQYISSPGDVRLWDLVGRMDGNASASRSVDPNNPENSIGGAFFSPGLEVNRGNSTMKNEILFYGRILDTKRRAAAEADTTKTR